ncbi:hypothetical protein UK12_21645 [Saccharothrix sp. ST-888]|nr:hypothetical protein UK12_21645 [Saccharothrix sp. ST-888]
MEGAADREARTIVARAADHHTPARYGYSRKKGARRRLAASGAGRIGLSVLADRLPLALLVTRLAT